MLWFVLNRLPLGRVSTEAAGDDGFVDAWAAYRDVNLAIAGEIARIAEVGEAVVVNDYQLALVPEMLTHLRDDVRTVFFLHTAFPGRRWFNVLPELAREQLVNAWRSKSVGFHSARWQRAFQETAVRTHTFVAPLAPDAVELKRLAESSVAAAARRDLETVVDPAASLILRVERLDPTKNAVRGVRAFELLLNREPRWRQRVQMLFCAVPSRNGVEAYEAYRLRLEQAILDVNERHGGPTWTPIVFLERDDYIHSVAAFERYDVLFVNSISDGMNLVAKEGPILNRFDGVLCLSPETGAFDELGKVSVPAYPLNTWQTAGALHHALSMPKAERAARAVELRSLSTQPSPATWLSAVARQATYEGRTIQ